ncbi:hypothetical protein Q668_12400 [Alcanivorax sp. PN-3]|nr:hypothetical protein Q668_12400 [Alcanivorax sp. PN-3]
MALAARLAVPEALDWGVVVALDLLLGVLFTCLLRVEEAGPGVDLRAA